MTQQPFEQDPGQHLLKQVRNGMLVYDQHGAEIGTVEQVHLGLPAATLKVGDTTRVEAREQAVFGSDRLPEMLRTHLLEQGFVRVDRPGPRPEDRYMMPEQIDRIEDDRIYLRVPLDRTIQR